ncbi:diacylglycerol kinase family protein [Halobacillus yeomjeoni]|uniref:Diacylglycerol kinase family protein n=1 Tax=Halobacillus yeomjeoni TaxID=311194 RepID=A0A931HUX8_9BACI|nr:diacylglycerol kinase family protein [Halobacillus yeomjeoni]MBH0229911.1 diacylglycerol kinase family protein [Halobacillus yeomjeoni]
MNSALKEPSTKKKSVGFRYAWKGIKEVFKTEKNFRIHLGAGFLAILAGLVLSLTPVEWAVIILTIAVILSLEMVNSSIERIIDYLAPERHPMAGMIKDIAAGAVLVSAVASVFIALVIFLPKVL